MKRVIVGLLLAVLLLAGCTPSTSLGSVAGYVYVREGTMPPNAQQADIRIQSQANPPFGYQPLANAQVSVRGSGVATSTNQSGFFRITGVTPGMRVVLVEHSWLRESIERVVEVHSDRTTYLTYGDAVIAGVGWYVLIGIENYQYLDRSRGAVADAERMYDVLLTGNRMGGSAQLLLDAQATKANIRYWIEEAARRADDHDYLVVYFSGRSDSVVWGEGLDHIVPYDGRIHGENPDHTLISDGELRDWLAPFPGRDVTV